MSATNGITILIDWVGASTGAVDNLIQTVNSGSMVEAVAGAAQLTASVGTLVNPATGLLTNVVALTMSGVTADPNGATNGQIITAVGNAVSIAASALALGGVAIPLVSVVGLTLTVGGAAYNYYEMYQRLKTPAADDSPIPDTVNDSWQSSRTQPRRDPLAIDLDADGIETLGINLDNQPPVVFDHDADGLKTGTGWLAGDDAWLVRDLDGNGLVDSGRELFGVDTLIQASTYIDGIWFQGTRTAFSGFEALSALDTGSGHGTSGAADGIFDLRDASFGELRLWRDLDADGISDTGELLTLADRGIVSISLASDGQVQDLGNGNRITGSATVARIDGSETDLAGVDLSAGNLDLAENPFYREFTDTIPLTDIAAALPEMGGSGWLRDLHEAMSLGTPEAAALVARVQQFAAAETRDEQLALLDGLLGAWAATSGRLNGRYVHAGQFAAEPVDFDIIAADAQTKTLRYATADQSEWQAMPNASLVLYQFQDTSLWQDVPDFGWNAPTAAGWAWLDKRNVLEVFNGQRFFGFDSVQAQAGGGSGTGSGGGGSGTPLPSGPHVSWVYNVANTQRDAINQAYDALRDSVFQALALQTRLRPYLDSVELVIGDDAVGFDTTAMQTMWSAKQAESPSAALGDLIDLVRHATSTLEVVGFDGLGQLRSWLDSLPADSDLLVQARLAGVTMGAAMSGTSGSDIWLGDATANSVDAKAGDDLLDADAGNDTVRGGDGHDHLRGGAGNDYLYGDAGSDMLDGGAGSDFLRGGAGSDLYRWGAGRGDDQIDEQTADDSGSDSLEIQGWAAGDLQIRRNGGDDVLITAISSGEKLTIIDGFRDDAASKWVEAIGLGDGTNLTLDDLRRLAVIGGGSADTLYGHATDDTIVGAAGDDHLYGDGGNDTLDSGDGNDYAYGHDGDDVLAGGAGTDYVYGDAGNDSLDGGTGTDYLRGSAGDDVYRWAAGYGNDSIDEQTSSGSGTDRIELAGLSSSAVTVSRNSGDDLVLTLSASGEKLTVVDGFREGYEYKWVESVVFADGTSWSPEQMRMLALAGTAGSDVLYGHASDDLLSAGAGNDTVGGNSGNDVIDAGAGNDQLDGGDGSDTLLAGDGNDYAYGEGGNDTLSGGTGSDYLYGDAGNDVLDGGAGVDYLRGSSGDDIYRWGQGSGNDVADEQTSSGSGIDRIELSGLLSSAFTVSRNSGDDLVLTLAATGERLTVPDGFREGYEYKWIESVAFADGSSWSMDQMRTLALTGTGGADSLYGHAGDDQLSAGAGNDTVGGNSGNDVIEAGPGNDQLHGGVGSDTLSAGDGNDYAYGQDGDDMLSGGGGSDYLYGDAGNDALDGGAGVDYLRGGAGDDIYRWAQGSGNDVADEQTSSGSGTDRIELPGLMPSAVAVSRNTGDDLVLTLLASGEKLTVTDGFRAGYEYKWIESVVFADGSAWSLDQMRGMLPAGAGMASAPGSPRWLAESIRTMVDAMASFGARESVGGVIDVPQRHAAPVQPLLTTPPQ